MFNTSTCCNTLSILCWFIQLNVMTDTKRKLLHFNILQYRSWSKLFCCSIRLSKSVKKNPNEEIMDEVFVVIYVLMNPQSINCITRLESEVAGMMLHKFKLYWCAEPRRAGRGASTSHEMHKKPRSAPHTHYNEPSNPTHRKATRQPISKPRAMSHNVDAFNWEFKSLCASAIVCVRWLTYLIAFHSK